MSLKEILNLALRARHDLEADRVSHSLMYRLYAAYNPGVDPIPFVDEAMRTFPMGACGLASVYLKHLYGEGEVIYGKYDCKGHSVIKLKAPFRTKNRVIIADITCDQYGGPKVYVGKLNAPWSLE